MRAFPPTNWSELGHSRDPNDPHRKTCLNNLCGRYYDPILYQIGRKGVRRADREDVAQEFVTWFITTGLLKAQQGQGLFRSYVLAYLDYFLAHYKRDKVRLVRRAGGKIVSIDALRDEKKLATIEPAHHDKPDAEFMRLWANTFFENAWKKVALDFKSDGHPERFELMRSWFTKGDDITYEVIEQKLGMTRKQVDNLIQHTKRRFKQHVTEEAEQTIGFDRDVKAEIALMLESSR